jgi:hypothetical protein
MTTTTKLVCTDCNHENEEERIYCHQCGARLDRSALIPRKSDREKAAAEAQKHLQKMFDPKRGRTKRAVSKLSRFVLGSVCCAALVLMFLPAEMPKPPSSDSFAPMINMDLVSATSTPQAAPLVYTQEQVNTYISSRLRRKDTAASSHFFSIHRVAVQFGEDRCTIKVERDLFGGFSLYGGSTYQVRIQNGKITAEPTSGFIGQMPIHPALLKRGNPLLLAAWSALARERTSVAKLGGIEFHPESVTLIPAH